MEEKFFTTNNITRYGCLSNKIYIRHSISQLLCSAIACIWTLYSFPNFQRFRWRINYLLLCLFNSPIKMKFSTNSLKCLLRSVLFPDRGIDHNFSWQYDTQSRLVSLSYPSKKIKLCPTGGFCSRFLFLSECLCDHLSPSWNFWKITLLTLSSLYSSAENRAKL